MASRLEYNSDFPDNILATVKEHLDELEWLLPPWCQCCTVYYCDDAHDETLRSGALASSQSSYEYRQAKLWFYPGFLRESSRRQKMVCVHELIHVSLSVLHDFANQELIRLVPEAENPNHHVTLLCELEARCESATQDLAFVISEKL